MFTVKRTIDEGLPSKAQHASTKRQSIDTALLNIVWMIESALENE